MNYLLRAFGAAALIAAGVVGDRVLSPVPNSSPVSPANAATQTNAAAAKAAKQSNSVAATRNTVSTATSLDAIIQHAFAVASPSVVYIENVGVGSGSGVIYDSTGDIVTNAHVVESAQTLHVTLSTGKTYTARIVGTDTADDLAVLHINARGLPAAHFAPAGSFSVAQTVLAIGSPLGLQQTVTSGLISALNRTVQEPNGAYLPNAIQTSAPINPGNSGGALVALDGSVVGIPTLEASDPQNNAGGAAQGIGFAVPSTRVTYIAHQIIATGRVAHTGRAYLGVSAVDASSAQQSPFGGFGGGFDNTPNIQGALVQTVQSGSPADRAGIQQGDIITAANGQPISGESDLLVALARLKPGDTLTLTINRNGSNMTVRVTVGELPAS